METDMNLRAGDVGLYLLIAIKPSLLQTVEELDSFALFCKGDYRLFVFGGVTLVSALPSEFSSHVDGVHALDRNPEDFLDGFFDLYFISASGHYESISFAFYAAHAFFRKDGLDYDIVRIHAWNPSSNFLSAS
jgi:hypothetical protein